MLNHAGLQVNVCKRHNILVSKGLEYSLVISIFCSIEHLTIQLQAQFPRSFSNRKSIWNRFQNLPIIINFIWVIIFIVSSLILRRKLVSFWFLQIHELVHLDKYMNWLIWTKVKNLKCYWKHVRDGNLFRKRSKVVECCRPVSGIAVFWLDGFWI